MLGFLVLLVWPTQGFIYVFVISIPEKLFSERKVIKENNFINVSNKIFVLIQYFCVNWRCIF